ncbi:hypothetical protein LOTGIDRAFT_229417 [Lottia gigantea]|uniref:Uncharacterized protein n=1 Tax=Lottia gigantea TaxID=225164 RepID=V3Z427_LOTGI|nr:hypothetical protein LOTGIDRAFT_229417 [Lottia gigantea]ESO85393.1 hypothetical protein LOTGIDRAFT_229417 [Lottia gigantea]
MKQEVIKMVGKKSEYQKQFSPAILTKHIPIYQDNLACRIRRRDQQFAHTSIAWDSCSDSTSEDDVKEIQHKLEELKLKEKQEALIRKKEEKRTKSPAKVDKCIETHLSLSGDEDEELYNGDFEKIRKSDFGKTKVIHGKKKIKRPDQSKKIPKGSRTHTVKASRPSTAPSKQSVRRPRTPFVSYGAGDGDRYSGKLWTHNVLADTDVYPAALRAKEKHEEEMRKKVEKHDKYVWLDDRKKNAILKLMKKETGDWDTEYKRHYPAYDKVIYERALSARPDSSCRREY